MFSGAWLNSAVQFLVLLSEVKQQVHDENDRTLMSESGCAFPQLKPLDLLLIFHDTIIIWDPFFLIHFHSSGPLFKM